MAWWCIHVKEKHSGGEVFCGKKKERVKVANICISCRDKEPSEEAKWYLSGIGEELEKGNRGSDSGGS